MTVEIWGKPTGGEWECIDECEKEEVNYLLGEYRLAYGAGWSWKIK